MSLIKSKRYVPYVIIIGVIIIPLLYSYFYLGAFWDPYARLHKVPVAVVNEDTGAMIDNQNRNVGQELCEELRNNESLKFSFTNAKDAMDGLKNTTYYAVITIPQDYSKSIATISGTKKVSPIITYTSNEKRNYLATQILNNAVAKLEKSIRSSMDQEIVSTLADQLRTTPAKLQTLSNGIGQLQTGATSLQTATQKLQNGLESVNSGTQELLTGSQTLNSGMSTYSGQFQQFVTGLQTVQSGSDAITKNLVTLQNGMNQIVTGATALTNASDHLTGFADGTTALSKGTNSLQEGISTYTKGVDALLSQLSQTTQVLDAYAQKTSDPTITQIVANLKSEQNLAQLAALKQATKTLIQSAATINSGAKSLSDHSSQLGLLQSKLKELTTGLTAAKKGISALTNASTSLSTGLSSLSNAGDKLSVATNQLTSGVANLDTGLNKLSEGTKRLSDGSTAMVTGSNQLTQGLTTANTEVTDAINQAATQLTSLDGIDEYAANPVTIQSDPYAAVPNYGTAFAPYFLSLSLWVGGLMIFFGIYFDPDQRFELLSRNSMHPIKRTLVYLLFGLLQAFLLCIVLIGGLGLHVNNLGLYLVSSCLVSMVFITIIQLLLIFFKNIGKFLAIALLILQLTSCGGTFPMETVPRLFNRLFPFMPMTYSVGLFKEAISGTNDISLILYHMLILAAILVVALGLTVALTLVKKRRIVVVQ